jgi:hypothetical protein
MPDVFANITRVPSEMLDVIANVLETRAAIPSQQQMISSYLGEIEFPENARFHTKHDSGYSHDASSRGELLVPLGQLFDLLTCLPSVGCFYPRLSHFPPNIKRSNP